MGAKGSVMKTIRQRSGATINVNENCEDGTDERNIMVAGPLASVQSARRLQHFSLPCPALPGRARMQPVSSREVRRPTWTRGPPSAPTWSRDPGGAQAGRPAFSEYVSDSKKSCYIRLLLLTLRCTLSWY